MGIIGQKGFGILQALMLLAVVGLLTLSALYFFQNTNLNVSQVKAQMGKDSLSNFLIPVLSEQTLCAARLLPTITYNANALHGPGGGLNGPYMKLAFLQSDNTLPAVGAAATFFPQFNLTVNSVYFANATQQKPELTGPYTGYNVYKGEVWVSVSGPPAAGGAAGPLLADRQIANSVYLWVTGTTIGSCGIMKTAQEACVDDLGGAWNPAPGPGVPNCGSIPFPCPTGSYYLGSNAGVPNCILSPASPTCNAGQTVVSNGAGATVCADIP